MKQHVAYVAVASALVLLVKAGCAFLPDLRICTELGQSLNCFFTCCCTCVVQVAKGARDFLPDQMAIREAAFGIITSVFKRHGEHVVAAAAAAAPDLMHAALTAAAPRARPALGDTW
jgi:hypothetical protein